MNDTVKQEVDECVVAASPEQTSNTISPQEHAKTPELDEVILEQHQDEIRHDPPKKTFWQNLKTKFYTKEFFNVIILGISFMFFFSAFGPSQSFTTSMFDQAGFFSLSILYFFLAFSNPFAPAFVELLGPKLCMIIGAVPYVVFVLAVVLKNAILNIISSVFLGIGGALLWNAHGEMMSRCAEDKDMGFFSGIFFSILSVNGMLGNGVIGIMLSLGISRVWSFGALFFVAAIGVFLLLLVRPIERKHIVVEKVATELNEVVEHSHDEPHSAEDHPEVMDTELLQTKTVAPPKENVYSKILHSIKQTVLMFINRKMNLLQGMSLYTGFIRGFMNGTIPPRIGSELLAKTLFIMALATAISAVIVGKISDVIGRRPVVIVLYVIHAIYLAMTFVVFDYEVPWWLMYVMFFLYGFADSGMNTQVYAGKCIVYHSFL
jgi:MFS family permease